MKKVSNVKFVFVLLAVVLFYSCKPLVLFDEPQPADLKNLSGIKPNDCGVFESVNDNSVLYIEPTVLRLEQSYTTIYSVSNLDSNLQLDGNILIDLSNGEKSEVKIYGDSILQETRWIDTLFLLGESGVLRKWNGSYFLNVANGVDSWEVYKLEVKKSYAAFYEIESKEEVEKLNSIVAIPVDSISNVYSLSKKEFKQFVKKNGFGKAEMYYRVK